MTPREDVCVVIPVFNEASVIADVVAAVREHYPLVVCVDDGSSDGSAAAIAGSGAILVQHPINLGQGAALRTGLVYALSLDQARYFVTFDADGQHDIADVPQMLRLLDSRETQIAFGSRFLDDRTTVGRAKRMVLAVAVRYSRASTGLSLTDTHNGLRAFTREVAGALDLQINGMAHASELLSLVARNKFRYAEVPVHIRYTEYSRGKGQPLMNGVNIIFDLLFR
jgi:glycosyltransferase involved in cell wall biosynthesis